MTALRMSSLKRTTPVTINKLKRTMVVLRMKDRFMIYRNLYYHLRYLNYAIVVKLKDHKEDFVRVRRSDCMVGSGGCLTTPEVPGCPSG
jgi:hypothetical protein